MVGRLDNYDQGGAIDIAVVLYIDEHEDDMAVVHSNPDTGESWEYPLEVLENDYVGLPPDKREFFPCLPTAVNTLGDMCFFWLTEKRYSVRVVDERTRDTLRVTAEKTGFRPSYQHVHHDDTVHVVQWDGSSPGLWDYLTASDNPRRGTGHSLLASDIYKHQRTAGKKPSRRTKKPY